MSRQARKEEKAQRRRARKEAEERGQQQGTSELPAEHDSPAAPAEA